jgi:hypothetical protein
MDVILNRLALFSGALSIKATLLSKALYRVSPLYPLLVRFAQSCRIPDRIEIV